jgi:hypothetical protein
LYSILIYVDTGGLGSIVLGWHIHPIFALGTGENLGIFKGELENFAFGNAFFHLRIRMYGVFFGSLSEKNRRKKKGKTAKIEKGFHVDNV